MDIAEIQNDLAEIRERMAEPCEVETEQELAELLDRKRTEQELGR